MLYIIRGLPGSGKSTYAKTNFPLAKQFEADMYFVQNGKYAFNPAKLNAAHKWCQNMVRKALENDDDVVVSNTFIQEWELMPYIGMAMDTKTPITIIEMTTQYGSIHDVPESKMVSMQDRWEDIKDMELVQDCIKDREIAVEYVY